MKYFPCAQPKKSCGAQEGKSLGTFSLRQQGQDDVGKKEGKNNLMNSVFSISALKNFAKTSLNLSGNIRTKLRTSSNFLSFRIPHFRK